MWQVYSANAYNVQAFNAMVKVITPTLCIPELGREKHKNTNILSKCASFSGDPKRTFSWQYIIVIVSTVWVALYSP